jgi:hypothetical protein
MEPPNLSWLDEDMTPMNTTINYKVLSFLHLHSNFGYNSLGSTCTCCYLNVGTNMSQSTSPSKLNFWFIGNPIVLHWEGHNSSTRSAIEVNEHLMESLFDILPLFLSGVTASSQACYSYLEHMPKFEHAPRRWRTPKRCPRMSSSLATTLGGQQGHPSQAGGSVQFEFESASAFWTGLQ